MANSNGSVPVRPDDKGWIEVRDARDPGWTWIDNELIDRFGPELGPGGIAIYLALARLANNETQECWPSVETLGQMVGIASRVTVRKHLRKLQHLKLVQVEQRHDLGDLTHIYTLLKLPEPATEGGGQILTTSRPGGQKLTTNKTHISTCIQANQESFLPNKPDKPDRLDSLNKPDKQLNQLNLTRGEGVVGEGGDQVLDGKTGQGEGDRENGKTQPFDAFLAWADAMGVDPEKVPRSRKSRECKGGKELIEAGWSLQEVRDCIAFMRTEDFWWDNPNLSLTNVVQIIPHWDARGRPQRSVRDMDKGLRSLMRARQAAGVTAEPTVWR